MPLSERNKELKRRRHRRKKLTLLAKKVEKGGDKAEIAAKIRLLTPGAEVLIKNWGLEE